MKRDNSLCDLCEHVCKRWKVSDTPVDKVDAHAERSREAVKRETPVGLEELVVREDAHLPDVVSCVWREDAVGFEMCLLQCGCSMAQYEVKQ